MTFKMLNLSIKKACISIDTGFYGNSILYQLTRVNNNHANNENNLIHGYKKSLPHDEEGFTFIFKLIIPFLIVVK